MSLITPALDAVRRIAGAIGNLLPATPDSAPPDIDGKRQGELDPEGKGGYR
jgi:hypothetical protein